MRWLEILVIGIYAFQTSGSPFVVSLMLVARMAPMVLFGTMAGAVVESMDRRRVQIGARFTYAEIQDNVIAASCGPIDILRGKLAFFGASKFDPKSDLWTRITMYQGAPLDDELNSDDSDDWCFPVKPLIEPCTSH